MDFSAALDPPAVSCTSFRNIAIARGFVIIEYKTAHSEIEVVSDPAEF
jgi:hypothetical protein